MKSPLLDGDHDAGHEDLAKLLPSPPESLDFDMWESMVNMVYNIELLKRGHANAMLKWCLIFLIGVVTALVAVFVDFFVGQIRDGNLDMLYSNLGKERSGEQASSVGFAIFASANAAMVLFAAMLVVLGEPKAAGSGIPEIKTLLNGINVPNVLALRTLCCKAIGVLFSVAGGLPCGKEGPMIHSGAILGAGIPLGKSSVLGIDASFKLFQVRISQALSGSFFCLPHRS